MHHQTIVVSGEGVNGDIADYVQRIFGSNTRISLNDFRRELSEKFESDLVVDIGEILAQNKLPLNTDSINGVIQSFGASIPYDVIDEVIYYNQPPIEKSKLH